MYIRNSYIYPYIYIYRLLEIYNNKVGICFVYI